MTTAEFFHWIQNTEFATQLGQAPLIYGTVAQLIHITGFLLILTSSLLISLRVLGSNFTDFTALELKKKSQPAVLIGLLFVVVSGAFMLLPSAELYEPNPAFWLKMKLLVAALVSHFLVLGVLLGKVNFSCLVSQLMALVNLLLWLSVAVAGRAIGFFAA